MLRYPATTLLFLFPLACMQDTPTCRAGKIGCACRSGGECNDGLVCSADGRCAAASVLCGNGSVDDGESCDDGNAVSEPECPYGTPTCSACDGACQVELYLAGRYCGDGIEDDEEVCDDGNNEDETRCVYGTPTCTQCSSTCRAELTLTGPYCGDANWDSEEECDDGNSVVDDGCTPACRETMPRVIDVVTGARGVVRYVDTSFPNYDLWYPSPWDDLNGDGRHDVAVVRWPGTLSIWYGKPDFFGIPLGMRTIDLATRVGDVEVVVGREAFTSGSFVFKGFRDFDGDGTGDLIIRTGAHAPSTLVYTGVAAMVDVVVPPGSIDLTDVTADVMIQYPGLSVDVADFNADGRADILAGGADGEMIVVYGRDLQETALPLEVDFADGDQDVTLHLPVSGWTCVPCDIDGDGSDDLLFSGSGTSQLLAYLGRDAEGLPLDSDILVGPETADLVVTESGNTWVERNPITAEIFVSIRWGGTEAWNTSVFSPATLAAYLDAGLVSRASLVSELTVADYSGWISVVDVDGDGHRDFAGQPAETRLYFGPVPTQSLNLESMAENVAIHPGWTSTVGERFGYGFKPVGDVNGDGAMDFMFGDKVNPVGAAALSIIAGGPPPPEL